MTPLEKIIRERIAQTGGITIAEYMELCLGHPEHGYYMSRQPFGREGDFITAPEASQIFGELVGVWVAAGWQAMGAPERIALVELGPGRGTLMRDILRAVRVMPGFMDAVRVHLVEMSPALRRVQEEMLAGCGAEVSWHADLAEVPRGPAIVVANEFFDALPVHHYERLADGWRERLVVTDGEGGFRFAATGRAPDHLPEWAEGLEVGSIIELSPERLDFMKGLATRLVDDGGAFLVFDYGHAMPGEGETLQAVMRHEQVSVFHRPGEADLTAHVDFHALAVAAERVRMTCWGPVEQGPFLRAMGLAARYEMLRRRASARQRIILKRGVERIAGDAQMGRLFKVLAGVSPGLPAPAPFEPSTGEN